MARKMQRGRGGVEYEDIRVGTGEEVATREHEALVSLQMFLHRGDCVANWPEFSVDLKRREHAIAGLRYGIEGMRISGVRRIVIPAQLGYGEHGVSAGAFPLNAGCQTIPPGAMLICEVELLQLKSCYPIRPKLKLALERKAAGIQVKPPRESKRKGRAE